MTPFALIGRLCFIFFMLGSFSAHAWCIFRCETPEQTAEREQREAEEKRLQAEQDARHAQFIAFHDLGVKKKYSYSDAQLTLDAIQGWKLILVVDRRADGQRLKIYQNRVLTATWMISTGLEGYRVKSGQKRFVHTPLGRFRPSRLYPKYRSVTWGEDMPYSIFFTNDGVAFHATKDLRALGRRASAGCVRLHPEHAAKLYELVNANRSQTLIVVHEPQPDGR